MNSISDKQFRKNFIWNIIGTSFNAFNSLFFMVIVTRVNGMSDSGIFTLAFSIACLLCIIGGYEGRVFQVTDIRNEFNDKEYILHRLLTTFLMMFIAFMYTVIMGYNLEKIIITLLLCAMKGLEVVADVFYGILQKNNELYKVGYSLFAKSILSVIAFLLIDVLTNNLIYACMILVIVWAVILLIYDIPQAMVYIRKTKKHSVKNICILFKSGFFAFSILFLSMYLINAPKYALDGRVAEDLQAIYGIILMPATIISLCAQYLLQPFLGKLSSSFKNNDKITFKKIVNLIFIIIFVIGILAVIICKFLGIPVLNLVYGVTLDEYANYLLIIIVGAICYALGTLFSTALTTVRKTFIQFIIYVVSSIFGFIASFILIDQFGLFGATLSYLLIMVLQFILYFICYAVVIKRMNFIQD